MSQGFKCDFCKRNKAGLPAVIVKTEAPSITGASPRRKSMDMCANCLTKDYPELNPDQPEVRISGLKFPGQTGSVSSDNNITYTVIAGTAAAHNNVPASSGNVTYLSGNPDDGLNSTAAFLRTPTNKDSGSAAVAAAR